MNKSQIITLLIRKVGQYRSLYLREKRLRKVFSKGIKRFPRL